MLPGGVTDKCTPAYPLATEHAQARDDVRLLWRPVAIHSGAQERGIKTGAHRLR